ncbi:MAG: hypothetical protein GY778_24595 [bacterium]|nr:hypothetical protein [bacterium]
MNMPPLISGRMLTYADLERPSAIRRCLAWIAASRSHRVLCLVAGLWVINLFDLALTVLAHSQGVLAEVNPLARKLLPYGPQALATFKFTLVGIGSGVLIAYRTRLIAELAATTTLIIYAGVAVRWRLCYELYHISAQPTTHPAELERLDVWVSSFPML